MDKTLKKIHARLPESLLVTTLVIFWSLATWAVFLRFQALPEVAEFLPAENVEALFTLNMDAYRESTQEPLPSLTSVLGQPAESLLWAENISWILADGQWLMALQPSSKSQAWNFLESLKRPKEDWERLGSNWCYKTLPNCFRFAHGHLWVAYKPEVLNQALDEAGPSLRETSRYQNVHARLPLLSDAFAYINLDESRLDWAHHMGLLGFEEPGYLAALFQFFPAYGLSASFEKDHWKVNSFTALDKNFLENSSLFRAKEKYTGSYLALVNVPMRFEWGTQKIGQQRSALKSILDEISPAAALALQGAANEWIQGQSAEVLNLESAEALFQGEIYFGHTQMGEKLLIGQVDPNKKESITALFGDFAGKYQAPIQKTLENGEQRAELKSVEARSSLYEGTPYTSLQIGESSVMVLALVEDKLIVSTSKDLLFSILDRLYQREPQRDLSRLNPLLLGADSFGHLNLDLSAELSIIKDIQWTSKTFDDGMSTRMILTPL